ncbi:hypothetical protein [Oceanirhabdus seepicola]|uniref:Uncharacterized protein n=1 Tax=Oceanirhabdus seepicola TaxID=2828781 RepID=A0A9J6NV31_9CLOT|nr:hypothetical protein [Oceanirhabdus seepicola]MCM1988343.1 hypothetical protein [Oceanirhabdus seepicola]
MLEQIKKDILKIKDWCEKNKKISVTIALVIGSGLVLGEMFDSGYDEHRYEQSQQITNQESTNARKFSGEGNGRFGGDGEGGGGDDRATLNPQLALTNLLIVLGSGAIVGAGVFIYISSSKKKIKPLPVLYNPINKDDKEV